MSNIKKKPRRELTKLEKQIRKWEYSYNFKRQNDVYDLRIKQDKKHLIDIEKMLKILKVRGLGIGKSPIYEELLTRINLITGDIKAMQRAIRNNDVALKNAHRIVDTPK